MDRCNVRECNHADDDRLFICESCLGKTCAHHAKDYKDYFVCARCAKSERHAKMKALDEILSIDMFEKSAGDVAARLIEIAHALDDWDVPLMQAAARGLAPCEEKESR